MTILLNGTESLAETPKGCIHLTPKEYDILEYMMNQTNRYLSPEEIYAAVWGAEPFSCRTVVAVHICHLRQKIETDPSRPSLLRRARGKGYRFYER